MTETAAAWQVTEPGAYLDVDHAVYVADPVPGGSLSASGVRRLLPPSTPAHFRWWSDHPSESTKAMTLGTAAHRTVLGIGPGIHVTKETEWRTDKVKAEVKEAQAAGKAVLKPQDAEVVLAMAEALRADGLAGRVFDLEHGTPEPSLFWQQPVELPRGSAEPVMDVWRRCRLDWLNRARPGQRLIIPDYKTCADASEAALSRSMWDYGYHVQAQFQADAVTALGLAGDTGEPPGFVLVAQETTAPYLVNVVQPDAVALRWARRQIDAALRLFAQCTAAGDWPGFSARGVRPLALPGWAERDLDLMIEDGTLEALP